MKKLFYIALTSLMVSCCYFPKENVELKGQKEAKVMNVEPFSRLDVQDAFEVIISDTVSDFRIESDIALTDYIRVIQTGKKLLICYQKNICWTGESGSKVFIPSNKAHLNHIYISGASSVKICEPLCAQSVNLQQSGASTLYATLHVNSVNAHLSGCSHAFLDGEAEAMRVQISGASAVCSEQKNGQYALEVTKLYGNISGSSVVNIHCTGLIDACLSGSSVIFYTGNADARACICSGASCVVQEPTASNS